MQLFLDSELRVIQNGEEVSLYDKLGAQFRRINGEHGVVFSVWAPNAESVSVVGDFNGWNPNVNPLNLQCESGIWACFVSGVSQGAHYKFFLLNSLGQAVEKTDPMGRFFEQAPKNSAIVWDTSHFDWTDQAWMKARSVSNPLESPMSIYEMHLGSWRKHNNTESYSYKDLAGELVEYVVEMGFTHIEFMPVAEHAYYPSWGYQVTGFYAPTSRYGTPDEFAALVDAFHAAGIGVILDWVPAHFPKDDYALARFDGTALYEHEDPRLGEHPDWGTLIFNYGCNEVVNYLTSNALYWFDRFHVDGLRVDAVASMLYLDYSRKEGEWIPNKEGGRENLEAIKLLRNINHQVIKRYPGVVMIAEESTSWPKVTQPIENDGLGFSLKWNMGWMHDNLSFFKQDPKNRKSHFDKMTFAMLYHYNENFVLPLSHDEVVHMKGSLFRKMPDDEFRGLANLRILFGCQWLFPGKHLLFMGGEIGQKKEWNQDCALDWELVEDYAPNLGLQNWVRDLNQLYREHVSLWESDFDPDGFQWVNCSDREKLVLSFVRRNKNKSEQLLVIVNFSLNYYSDHRVGVAKLGEWEEVLNSDKTIYGGVNKADDDSVKIISQPCDGMEFSVSTSLAPLALIVLRSVN
jgi:1,4-alpha-glucan branching enzyme